MIPKPEYHSHEEFQNRTKKLEDLKKLGIDPFPHEFHPTINAKELETRFATADVGHSEDALSGKGEKFIVAGRLVLFRAMGKNAFAHIQDEEGRIQIMINRDLSEVAGYNPEKIGKRRTIEPYEVN